MLKKQVLLAPLLVLLASGCKILPHKIRSGAPNDEVGLLLDTDSLKFERAAGGKSGLLSFNLKEQHNCRVEYWADDPSGTPPPASPLSLDCPNDQSQLVQHLTIPGLTVGFPLSFRIYVWPKTLNFLTHFTHEYREGQDISKAAAKELVVVRYASPRNSAEIYNFRSPTSLSVQDIKTKLKDGSELGCVDHPSSSPLPFARNASLEDPLQRPLHGLSLVKTEGFGSAAAIPHPFFPTRLVEFYEQTERQENWKWNFQWEGKPYSFDSFPPGYIGSLSVSDGTTNLIVKERKLSGAMESFELKSNILKFSPKIIFPTELAHFDVMIKSSDASKILMTCRFPIDRDVVQVPTEWLSKLGAGTYLVTFSFETNQVHYRDQSSYPPWIISSQDWLHFRMNKRL